MRHLPLPANGSFVRQVVAMLALPAASLSACASSPTAHFRGAAAAPAIAANEMQQHTYVPHDHLAIGTVAVDCQHASVDNQDDRCSELVLLRTMRAVAASCGGTAFVAPSCRYETVSPSAQHVRCTATVARRRSLLAATATATDTSVAQQRRWDAVIEGRTIRITAVPGPGVVPKPHAKSVRRTWAVDASAKKLGTVQAECVERCQRALVERGLKQGAAWIGAEEVGQVQCHEVEAGRWSCTGVAFSGLTSGATTTRYTRAGQ